AHHGRGGTARRRAPGARRARARRMRRVPAQGDRGHRPGALRRAAALRGRHLGRLPPRGDPAVEERREAEAPRAHRRDVAARGAPQISQAAEAHRVRTQGCSDRGMRVTELLESIRTGIGGLPAHGKGALLLLLLYAVQSEIRFGAKARSGIPGATDRWSTLAVSLSAAVPVVGFVLAM